MEPDRSLLDVVGLNKISKTCLGSRSISAPNADSIGTSGTSPPGSRTAMKSEYMYLHHIRERCERVAACVHAGRETFFGSVVYQTL